MKHFTSHWSQMEGEIMIKHQQVHERERWRGKTQNKVVDVCFGKQN